MNEQEQIRKRVNKPLQNTSIMEHGKIPPQAIDLEETVLGAIMLEKNILPKVIDFIRTEVFYRDAHQKIYAAILELSNENLPIDILTVTAKLRKLGDLEMVGGPFYITELTNKIASSANIEYHARIILQKYIQREVIRISGDAIRNAFEDTSDIYDIIDELNLGVKEIENSLSQGEINHISEFTSLSIMQMQQRKDLYGSNKVIGIPTGLHELNKLTCGFQTGLVIIAARPSMGKTAFILFLMKVAAKAGIMSKIYELEMTGIKLSDRLLLSETNIDIDMFRYGNLNDNDILELNTARKTIDSLPIYVNDKSGIKIDYICRDAKATKNKHPKLGMIVIDHGGLVDGENKTNRNNEIGNITAKAKTLSKQLDVPVLLLFQLSRKTEDRNVKDKRPILTDLRDSGNIEQDADIVSFIYRPYYYGKEVDEFGNDLRNMGEIIVRKNRDGMLGTARFNHNKGLTKFYDYEEKIYTGDEINIKKEEDNTPF